MTPHLEELPGGLTSPTHAADAHALLELYHASFPVHELLPAPVILSRPTLLARRADLPLAGFATTFELSLGVVLLEYLAVAPEARSQGIGTALVSHLAARTPLLIECDPPTTPPHPAFGDPRRRLRFYERLGARLLTTDHLVDLGTGPTRFHLLGLGHLPAAPRVYTEALHAEVYALHASSHPHHSPR